MLTTPETWRELSEKYRIDTDGGWRKSVNMRAGRRLEAQIFSSSSLENVHSMGAFSIIRHGASIGGVVIGRFSGIGAGFVGSAPEHPVDSIGMSSVFMKNYPWAKGGERFYEVPQSGRRLVNKRIEIGSDVWIGRDVYIKGGVKVGHGAIIAARSVVTKDVAPYSIVAGTPAKHIRQRFPDEVVAALLELEWWNYDPIWMKHVDQKDIHGCVRFLHGERNSLSPLNPVGIVFTESGYRET